MWSALRLPEFEVQQTACILRTRSVLRKKPVPVWSSQHSIFFIIWEVYLFLCFRCCDSQSLKCSTTMFGSHKADHMQDIVLHVLRTTWWRRKLSGVDSGIKRTIQAKPPMWIDWNPKRLGYSEKTVSADEGVRIFTNMHVVRMHTSFRSYTRSGRWSQLLLCFC